MPKCKICGARLAEGATRCLSCGANVGGGTTVSATATTTAAKPTGSAPKQFFSQVSGRCPSCGEMFMGEHRLCPKCGMDLQGAKGGDASTNAYSAKPSASFESKIESKEEVKVTETQTYQKKTLVSPSEKSESVASSSEQKTKEKDWPIWYYILVCLSGIICLIGFGISFYLLFLEIFVRGGVVGGSAVLLFMGILLGGAIPMCLVVMLGEKLGFF